MKNQEKIFQINFRKIPELCLHFQCRLPNTLHLQQENILSMTMILNLLLSKYVQPYDIDEPRSNFRPIEVRLLPGIDSNLRLDYTNKRQYQGALKKFKKI